MRDTILEKLTAIENEHGVKILYACESGSRAWGFHSPDSDYDVRFIYIHEQDWYLGIEDKKDFIQLPVSNELDIVGYDLRKMLKLFRGSNAKIFEWIQSPVVCRHDENFLPGLRPLIPQYYSSRSGIHHYIGLTRNTLNNDLQDEQVKLKKYFYALRPVLAATWIATNNECPPMEFQHLRAMVADAAIDERIDQLLDQKAKVDESFYVGKDESLNEFVRSKMEYSLSVAASMESKSTDAGALNKFFRKTIGL